MPSLHPAFHAATARLTCYRFLWFPGEERLRQAIMWEPGNPLFLSFTRLMGELDLCTPTPV